MPFLAYVDELGTVRFLPDRARVVIPMHRDLRSLNIAVSAAMILGEALRQTGGFPVLLRSPPPAGSEG